MRAYRIRVGGKTQFAGSQSESTTIRGELCEKYGERKHSGQIAEEDVPTNKADLLPFLNKLINDVQNDV